MSVIETRALKYVITDKQSTEVFKLCPMIVFPQHIKNNKDTNKYEGWPEVVEMEGCVPQKQD